jgi:ankyrin repeat protein
MKTVSLNRYSLTKYLIENDIIRMNSCTDSEKNTCLHLAAINSDIKMAKLFLKHSNELIDAKNKNNIDALTISVYNNDNLMFFLLVNNLQYNILNVNELCKLAIRNENIEILSYLTNRYYDILDDLLLHHACAQKNLQIFKHIIKFAKNFEHVDSSGETPLHWSVMRGTYHILNNLLKIMKEKNLNIDPKSRVNYFNSVWNNSISPCNYQTR